MFPIIFLEGAAVYLQQFFSFLAIRFWIWDFDNFSLKFIVFSGRFIINFILIRVDLTSETSCVCLTKISFGWTFWCDLKPCHVPKCCSQCSHVKSPSRARFPFPYLCFLLWPCSCAIVLNFWSHLSHEIDPWSIKTNYVEKQMMTNETFTDDWKWGEKNTFRKMNTTYLFHMEV